MTLLRRALNDARTAQAFQLLNPERNMKTYTGTKTLRAKPMTRDDYNTLRGWATPPEENGADEGYLVEYLDGGKANHADFENYISWSPKDVFERTYNETIQPHQQRVLDERTDLAANIVKLQAFLVGPVFQGLHATDCDLLSQQLTAMKKYRDILTQRIARF